jgi:hypothetical protein
MIWNRKMRSELRALARSRLHTIRRQAVVNGFFATGLGTALRGAGVNFEYACLRGYLRLQPGVFVTVYNEEATAEVRSWPTNKVQEFCTALLSFLLNAWSKPQGPERNNGGSVGGGSGAERSWMNTSDDGKNAKNLAQGSGVSGMDSGVVGSTTPSGTAPLNTMANSWGTGSKILRRPRALSIDSVAELTATKSLGRELRFGGWWCAEGCGTDEEEEAEEGDGEGQLENIREDADGEVGAKDATKPVRGVARKHRKHSKQGSVTGSSSVMGGIWNGMMGKTEKQEKSKSSGHEKSTSKSSLDVSEMFSEADSSDQYEYDAKGADAKDADDEARPRKSSKDMRGTRRRMRTRRAVPCCQHLRHRECVIPFGLIGDGLHGGSAKGTRKEQQDREQEQRDWQWRGRQRRGVHVTTRARSHSADCCDSGRQSLGFHANTNTSLRNANGVREPGSAGGLNGGELLNMRRAPIGGDFGGGSGGGGMAGGMGFGRRRLLCVGNAPPAAATVGWVLGLVDAQARDVYAAKQMPEGTVMDEQRTQQRQWLRRQQQSAAQEQERLWTAVMLGQDVERNPAIVTDSLASLRQQYGTQTPAATSVAGAVGNIGEGNDSADAASTTKKETEPQIAVLGALCNLLARQPASATAAEFLLRPGFKLLELALTSYLKQPPPFPTAPAKLPVDAAVAGGDGSDSGAILQQRRDHERAQYRYESDFAQATTVSECCRMSLSVLLQLVRAQNGNRKKKEPTTAGEALTRKGALLQLLPLLSTRGGKAARHPASTIGGFGSGFQGVRGRGAHALKAMEVLREMGRPSNASARVAMQELWMLGGLVRLLAIVCCVDVEGKYGSRDDDNHDSPKKDDGLPHELSPDALREAAADAVAAEQWRGRVVEEKEEALRDWREVRDHKLRAMAKNAASRSAQSDESVGTRAPSPLEGKAGVTFAGDDTDEAGLAGVLPLSAALKERREKEAKEEASLLEDLQLAEEEYDKAAELADDVSRQAALLFKERVMAAEIISVMIKHLDDADGSGSSKLVFDALCRLMPLGLVHLFADGGTEAINGFDRGPQHASPELLWHSLCRTKLKMAVSMLLRRLTSPFGLQRIGEGGGAGGAAAAGGGDEGGADEAVMLSMMGGGAANMPRARQASMLGVHSGEGWEKHDGGVPVGVRLEYEDELGEELQMGGVYLRYYLKAGFGQGQGAEDEHAGKTTIGRPDGEKMDVRLRAPGKLMKELMSAYFAFPIDAMMSANSSNSSGIKTIGITRTPPSSGALAVATGLGGQKPQEWANCSVPSLQFVEEGKGEWHLAAVAASLVLLLETTPPEQAGDLAAPEVRKILSRLNAPAALHIFKLLVRSRRFTTAVLSLQRDVLAKLLKLLGVDSSKRSAADGRSRAVSGGSDPGRNRMSSTGLISMAGPDLDSPALPFVLQILHTMLGHQIVPLSPDQSEAFSDSGKKREKQKHKVAEANFTKGGDGAGAAGADDDDACVSLTQMALAGGQLLPFAMELLDMLTPAVEYEHEHYQAQAQANEKAQAARVSPPTEGTMHSRGGPSGGGSIGGSIYDAFGNGRIKSFGGGKGNSGDGEGSIYDPINTLDLRGSGLSAALAAMAAEEESGGRDGMSDVFICTNSSCAMACTRGDAFCGFCGSKISWQAGRGGGAMGGDGVGVAMTGPIRSAYEYSVRLAAVLTRIVRLMAADPLHGKSVRRELRQYPAWAMFKRSKLGRVLEKQSKGASKAEITIDFGSLTGGGGVGVGVNVGSAGAASSAASGVTSAGMGSMGNPNVSMFIASMGGASMLIGASGAGMGVGGGGARGTGAVGSEDSSARVNEELEKLKVSMKEKWGAALRARESAQTAAAAASGASSSRGGGGGGKSGAAGSDANREGSSGGSGGSGSVSGGDELARVMASSAGRAALLAFAQTSDEWDDDCLRFYDLALQYEKHSVPSPPSSPSSSGDPRAMLRKQIMEQFVVSDSMNSIAISRAARDAVTKEYGRIQHKQQHASRSSRKSAAGGPTSPDASGKQLLDVGQRLFKPAMDEVLEMLREEIFPSFLHSPEYRALA